MTSLPIVPNPPMPPKPRPLCRDAEDDTNPCLYATTCHAARQELQHHHGLRGTDCWAFVRLREELGPDPAEGATHG